MSTSGSDRLLGKKEAFYLLAGIGLAILFSVVPLDNGKMTVLDGFVLGMGLFLWGLKTPGARLILVMVTFLVAIRYFVWRMTKTIYGGPLDLLVSLLLLLAELYSASLTFLGYYESLAPVWNSAQKKAFFLLMIGLEAQPLAILPRTNVTVSSYLLFLLSRFFRNI